MKKLTLLLPVLIGVTACQSTSNGVSVKQETVMEPGCNHRDDPSVSAPLWICDINVEGYTYTTLGFSQKRPTVSMTSASARADAQAQMAEKIAVQITAGFNEYQKSLTTEEGEKFVVDMDLVREAITSTTLMGTDTIRTLTSPTGGQYVLLGMKPAVFEATLAKATMALSDSDAEMKQLFENNEARERVLSLIKVQ